MLNRLSLQEVGPAPKLEIDFSPRVTLITGDNGLGKSFLLDIAWWALTRTWAHYPARPASAAGSTPTISFTFDSKSKLISHTSHFDWANQAWISKLGRPPSPGMVLYAQVDGSFSVWDPARNYWKKVTAKGVDTPDRPPAYLFRAAEVWDGLARPDPKDASRTEVLCNGLIRDWASWQKEQGSAYRQLCRVLSSLSSQEGELLEPGELTRISLDDVRDMPSLKMPYGKEVAIVHASAAIRRIAALAYLLVWTWQEHARASKLLNQETTKQIIFLVDEMEAHLHPTWQRRILRSLMDVMSALSEEAIDVQVIAVTHSPMLLASIEPVFDPAKDSLWMFDLVADKGGTNVILKRDLWHRRGDASAWLRSEVFDLKEARSLEAERAIAAARSLILGRETPERSEFLRIYDALRRSMPGDDPFWVEWRAWAWQRGLLDENQA